MAGILDKFRLDGKIAMVTGASRGLGRAIALGFAEAGADLVLVSRGKEALEETAKMVNSVGKKAWVFPFDLFEIEVIPKWFEDVIKEVERIDILANIAGTIYREKAMDFPLEQWDRVLKLNLTTTFVLSQQFARHCIQDGRKGKIINIASLLSEAARASIPAYAASKGGIRQLTKALAVEWAKDGINVNAIGPGYFETELTKPLVEDEKFTEWVKLRTPLGRWGKPEELVGTAVFLASESSDFITGQVIYVDGGWLANL
ncbi:MAG: SDR family oxidoreductase [Candidatus Marinimicrobia bacterium]|nr:SDR family oxidoreductase [Candidatus Neomarinimicrobiota bacterium]